jgi:hypothetical protein
MAIDCLIGSINNRIDYFPGKLIAAVDVIHLDATREFYEELVI